MIKTRFWNISRLKHWKRCEELYFNLHVRKIAPIGGEKKDEADYGHAIHVALETWFQGLGEAAALQKFEDEMIQYPDIEDMLVDGSRLLKGYFKRYPFETESFKVIQTEANVEAEIGVIEGMKHVLLGRLDTLIEGGIVEGQWDLQHKTLTYNRKAEDEPPKWVLDWHTLGYAWAQRRMKNVRYQGTLLDILRKQKRGAKNPSPPEYLRSWIPISEGQMDRFERDLKETIRRVMVAEREGSYVQAPDSCFDYFRKCAFHDLCKGTPFFEEDWEKTKEDYVDERNKEREEHEQIEEGS